jgi:hypothetical protein
MPTDTLSWGADPDSAVVSYTVSGLDAPVVQAAVPGQTTYTVPTNAITPGKSYTPTMHSTDSFGQNSPEIPFTPATITVGLPPAPTGPLNPIQVLSA